MNQTIYLTTPDDPKKAVHIGSRGFYCDLCQQAFTPPREEVVSQAMVHALSHKEATVQGKPI